jgi:hypothetical protein
MVVLKNWSVVFRDWNGYTAPELLPRYLHGYVYGHPQFNDGAPVTTSAIESVSGRVVKTYSREYFLEGDPDPAYVAELATKGIVIDPVNPIKVKKS